MNIQSCLLDADNPIRVGDTALGLRIQAHGKRALWDERQGGLIDTVVIHFISASETRPETPFELEAVLELFVRFGVSSHYLIDREGVARQLVPERKKAWHCGGSIMPAPDSRQGVNDFSIGIELVATEESGYTDGQYESCALLCRDIESRHGRMQYVGHQDIAGEKAAALGLRADIRRDPGPLFDWGRFHTLREGAV